MAAAPAAICAWNQAAGARRLIPGTDPVATAIRGLIPGTVTFAKSAVA